VELQLERVALTDSGEPWLTGIDLTLGAGISILMGPTLAGKTTLMRCIAGLSPPTSGRVLVNGQDVTKTSVRARSVSFVHQQFINYPSLSVYENIASPLRVQKKMDAQAIDARVHEVAEMMEIVPLLKRKPDQLSGGQQQRTAIARALARKADVVLLDEPLANLDYKLREQLRTELSDLFTDAGMIVVYSTAEPVEALYFAATTVVLHEGRIAQIGEALDLYRQPGNLSVARTMSDPPMNVCPATRDRGILTFAGASTDASPELTDAAADRDVSVGIRPHRLTVDRRSSADMELRGTIRLAEVTGSMTFVHLTIGDDQHLVLELDGTHEYAPGAAMSVYLDPEAIYAFDTATGELLVAAREEAYVNG
jgi:glycerol transport system ATP-binding protein